MSAAPAAVRPSPGPWRVLWRRLLHNRVAVTGGVLLAILYASACFAGFLAPYRYDEGDRDASRAAPMLFGGFEAAAREIPSKVRPGRTATIYERRWTWLEGGIHFRDQSGAFTLRPHVHPLTEIEYRDEWGERAYTRAEDRSVSLPVRFFVESENEHEIFSLLGLWPVESRLRLFGVEAPPGTQGRAHVFLLGSDAQGRDIFSRLLFGGQISLSVGLLGVLISMSLGMLMGGISGYFGGWIDFVFQRLVEVILAVPALYLIIVIGGQLRGMKHSDGKPFSSTEIYLSIVIVLAFVYWASISRVIRGMVLALKENEYVVAARALGVPTPAIIVRHILPNTFSFAIVTATLTIPYYILGEVALSFLGLGIQDPEASWGILLRDAQETAYLVEQPWVIAPGVFIFIAVMAFNFLGDGLRDAADPKAVIHTAKTAGDVLEHAEPEADD